MAAGGGERGLAEVRRGVDAAELRGLEQGVEDGGDLGAALQLRAEVISAADDGAADGALALLSRGMRTSLTNRVSLAPFPTTYAASPIESVFKAWFQSQVFIVAITSALVVRRNSAFLSRSPSASASIS